MRETPLTSLTRARIRFRISTTESSATDFMSSRILRRHSLLALAVWKTAGQATLSLSVCIEGDP